MNNCKVGDRVINLKSKKEGTVSDIQPSMFSLESNISVRHDDGTFSFGQNKHYIPTVPAFITLINEEGALISQETSIKIPYITPEKNQHIANNFTAEEIVQERIIDRFLEISDKDQNGEVRAALIQLMNSYKKRDEVLFILSSVNVYIGD